jgi:hypothetical protein
MSKWAHMTHLDTWHKLYPKERPGVKLPIWLPTTKSQKSPDFLAWKWRVTYRWKALDEGYNFPLNLISINDLHAKLWAPKVARIPVVGISGPPLGSPETKWHLGASPMAKHRVYYKAEGGGFPQVQAMLSLMSPWLPVARPCTKVLQLCTNQLVVWFVQIHVSK